MPKGGKLSDLGHGLNEIKNPFTANIQRKAVEWGLSDIERDAFIEFCEIGLWHRDKTKDTKDIIVGVCQKYHISDERFVEIFHLAFPFIEKSEKD